MNKKLDLKRIRIGVLTFHNAINFGAYLQAYCLSKYFERTYNVTICFLNYKNKNHYYNDLRHYINYR